MSQRPVYVLITDRRTGLLQGGGGGQLMLTPRRRHSFVSGPTVTSKAPWLRRLTSWARSSSVHISGLTGTGDGIGDAKPSRLASLAES